MDTLSGLIKNREKFVRGEVDPDLSDTIIKECELEEHMSTTKILRLIRHVDTYKLGNPKGWRVQGYVFAGDVCNEDITIPPSEVSVIDKDYVMFFTKVIPLPKDVK